MPKTQNLTWDARTQEFSTRSWLSARVRTPTSHDLRVHAAPDSSPTPQSETLGGPSQPQSELAQGPWSWSTSREPLVALSLLLATIPLVPAIPASNLSAPLYFGTLAVWAIYVGSHRSLNAPPPQSLSMQQSLAVPILCSFSLFLFYSLLRFFPDFDVRVFFSAYLSLVGAVAVGSHVSDTLRAAFPEAASLPSLSLDFPEWLLVDEGKTVTATITPVDLFAFGVGTALTVANLQPGAPFSLSNFIAVCIASEFLQVISLQSFKVAAIMLCGLLLYDVFWVFGSASVFGDNVMVTVATSEVFDGPMKLIFPTTNPAADHPFSILGLGDIAVPGLFMALMLRFDRNRWIKQQQTNLTAEEHSLPEAGVPSPSPSDSTRDGQGGESALAQQGGSSVLAADKSYFATALGAYVAGFGVTIGVNSLSGAAQPALLYLVPSLLLGILGLAVWREESHILFDFKDQHVGEAAATVPVPVEAKQSEQ